MKIGIVIADDNEYSPFLDSAVKSNGKETLRRGKPSVELTLSGHDIIAVKCGIGKVNAAAATSFLIADDKCDAIFNIGLSGAISHLSREDFIAGETFTECDFDLTPLGFDLGIKPQEVNVYTADKKLLDIALSVNGMKKGKFGSGDFFLTDSEKKHLYKEKFSINAFDMETAAIASVCHDCNTPLLSIRKISDTADDEASETYRELNDKCEKDLTEIIFAVLEKLN